MQDETALVIDYNNARELVDLLVDFSTGRGGEDSRYQVLRELFVKAKETGEFVPNWLRSKRTLDQFWQFIKYKFSTYQERREFLWSEFEGLLNYCENKGLAVHEADVVATLTSFDEDGVARAWEKARKRQDSDPDGAITASRTLVEEVCRHILDRQNIQYDANAIKLPDLYKRVSESLHLAPEQHSEKLFKQILGGCSSVINGLGSVRNKHGDAHAVGMNGVRPLPRHARLVVNLAGAMALFLVETYLKKVE